MLYQICEIRYIRGSARTGILCELGESVSSQLCDDTIGIHADDIVGLSRFTCDCTNRTKSVCRTA